MAAGGLSLSEYLHPISADRTTMFATISTSSDSIQRCKMERRSGDHFFVTAWAPWQRQMQLSFFTNLSAHYIVKHNWNLTKKQREGWRTNKVQLQAPLQSSKTSGWSRATLTSSENNFTTSTFTSGRRLEKTGKSNNTHHRFGHVSEVAEEYLEPDHHHSYVSCLPNFPILVGGFSACPPLRARHHQKNHLLSLPITFCGE